MLSDSSEYQAIKESAVESKRREVCAKVIGYLKCWKMPIFFKEQQGGEAFSYMGNV